MNGVVRDPGVHSVSFDHLGELRVLYLDTSRDEREFVIDWAAARVPWDWDGDPEVWVPMANAWLGTHYPRLAGAGSFVWRDVRTVEDHGEGDVREVYTRQWSFQIDGAVVLLDDAEVSP